MQPLIIYYETLITEKSSQEVWDSFFNHPAVSELFHEKRYFTPEEKGELFWKIFFFKKITGTYHVQSYVEKKNFLIDVAGDGFSSTLLITIDESENGIMLRLDHRSFVGKNKKIYCSRFSKRWNKVFKALTPKPTKEK